MHGLQGGRALTSCGAAAAAADGGLNGCPLDALVSSCDRGTHCGGASAFCNQPGSGWPNTSARCSVPAATHTGASVPDAAYALQLLACTERGRSSLKPARRCFGVHSARSRESIVSWAATGEHLRCTGELPHLKTPGTQRAGPGPRCGG